MTKRFHNIKIGQEAEATAVSFLKKKGFKILYKNYRTPVGEIDIIAKEKDTIVFIEVKARTSTYYGLPKEAVTAKKQQQIIKTALWYLKEKQLHNKSKIRFDVIAILLTNNKTKIEHIKEAFQAKND